MPKKDETFNEKEFDEGVENQEELQDVAEPADDLVSGEVIKMTSDVPVQVVAVLGKKTVSVKELVSFRMGQVLDLNRPPNEMVDLVAGGKLVAKGELVEIDGKLGVRIVKMVR